LINDLTLESETSSQFRDDYYQPSRLRKETHIEIMNLRLCYMSGEKWGVYRATGHSDKTSGAQ
jgi:hypothetical protein